LEQQDLKGFRVQVVFKEFRVMLDLKGLQGQLDLREHRVYKD